MATVNCPVLPISGSGEGGAPDGIDEVTESEPTPRPRAFGKMKTVVDVGNCQDIPASKARQTLTPFEYLSNPFILLFAPPPAGGWKNYQTTLQDRFRYEAGTFWGVQEEEEEGSTNTVGVFNYINSGVFERSNHGLVVPGAAFQVIGVSRQEDDDRDEVQGSFLSDFYKKQRIWLGARPELFSRMKQGEGTVEFSQALWNIWVNGGSLNDDRLHEYVDPDSRGFTKLFDTSKVFTDHAFRLSAPLLPKELAELNGLPRPAVVTTDMEYNFYVKEYESAMLRLPAHREALLPNMYVFQVEEKSQNLDEHQSIFWKLITLNGQIKDSSGKVLVSRDIMRNGRKVDEEDIGQYFDLWGRIVSRLGWGLLDLNPISAKYRKIVFSPLDIELFKSFNEKRFLYPMYVDIEFSTDRRTLLADAIKEAQLGTALMKAVIESPVTTIVPGPAYRPRFSWFKTATETIIGTGRSDKIVEAGRPRKRMVLDIVDWWTAFKDGNTINERKSVVLGTSLPEIFVNDSDQYRFVRVILSLIFSGKIRNTLRGRLRSFEDIMNGKHAYSETIFYKISKHSVNPISGRPDRIPIQDFFVPNSSELDLFRFIDTQVFFNKKYRYIVHAYEMVFGTSYEYREINQRVVYDDGAMIDVYTRPSIQLIETPIFSFDTQIADKPPLPPQVDIIPYRNVNNEILINLNVNSGELIAQPIAFNAAERRDHVKLRVIHDLEPDAPLEFKGDDPIDHFEIYRTTRRPRSYRDFANQLHTTLDTEVLSQNGKQISVAALSSASIVDLIRPNVKYYYTFRAVDIRGNISNPSAVFMFEMIENSGVVYPALEVVNFDAPEKKMENRNFKKYIHISAAPIQSEVNITNLLDIETAEDAAVELGIAEEPLFASHPNKKKIKVRLTSKDSGKKIDINLNFSHRHTS